MRAVIPAYLEWGMTGTAKSAMLPADSVSKGWEESMISTKRVVALLAVIALPAPGLWAQAARQVPMLLSSETACTVSVDGEQVAMLAAGGAKKIQVSPGEHLVVAVATDGRRSTQTVAARDAQVVVTFDFAAAAPQAAPAAAPAVAAAPAPAPVAASEPAPPRVPFGAKLFIAPMGGYESYLAAAIRKKEVPVTVVGIREQADFEITGTSESKKPGTFKMLMTGATGSAEAVSISVTHLRSGAVVYAYAYNKDETFRGKQSSAEACAKHLKNHMDGKE